DDVPPGPPAIVQGNAGTEPGLRIFWERVEGGQKVLAHGFVLPTQSGGRYRGRLPAGTYEVRVEDLRGTSSAARKVVLEPGMQLSLPLAPPAPGRDSGR
ncbi:MAG TPA: hypothetical protein VFX50_17415, partial [Gemmatimonadales bacterium]|nr:hypothetical protein [Gemmatimonadales bacterium]